jgi:hypothetical protein
MLQRGTGSLIPPQRQALNIINHASVSQGTVPRANWNEMFVEPRARCPLPAAFVITTKTGGAFATFNVKPYCNSYNMARDQQYREIFPARPVF